MRVISGFLGGRKFLAPKGLNTRPTTDRVKESLFNILGDITYEKEVLDLFAGSGSLGIEALSRYADNCIFVDQDSNSIKTIAQNLQVLGLKDKAVIYHMSWHKAVELFSNRNQSFDLIFLDPPYSKDLVNNALTAISNYGLLKKGGMIIAEHDKKDKVQEELNNLNLFKQRSYGNTVLSFYTLKEN